MGKVGSNMGLPFLQVASCLAHLPRWLASDVGRTYRRPWGTWYLELKLTTHRPGMVFPCFYNKTGRLSVVVQEPN